MCYIVLSYKSLSRNKNIINYVEHVVVQLITCRHDIVYINKNKQLIFIFNYIVSRPLLIVSVYSILVSVRPPIGELIFIVNNLMKHHVVIIIITITLKLIFTNIRILSGKPIESSSATRSSTKEALASSKTPRRSSQQHPLAVVQELSHPSDQWSPP